MTPSEQSTILQSMQQHLVDNLGNRITHVTVHGFMAALTIITQGLMPQENIVPITQGTKEQ